MGCSSSAPVAAADAKTPPTPPSRHVSANHDVIILTDDDYTRTEDDLYQSELLDQQKLTDTNPLIISENSLIQSSLLSLEGFQLKECPSFFNPVSKPVIFEYQFQQHIGHGAVSDVFLVKNTENGIFYAAKVYQESYLNRVSIGDSIEPIEKVSREMQIMSECQHPNILPLIEVLDDQTTRSLIFIMPYAEKGSLSKSSWKADPLPEPEAKNVFRQIASGLQYLHSADIIHRDLKPENILCFDDGHVAIADFSVSQQLEDPNQMLDDTEGTPVFYSPEQCSGDPYLGKPADCWAFGIILYVMIFGKLPYFEADDEAAYGAHFYHISQVISTQELTYPEKSKELSPELNDLFHHILERDPQKRYTIEQIVAHKWFAFDD